MNGKRGQSFKLNDSIEFRTRRKNKMESKVFLKGDVVLERRRNGKVIDREELHNLIVNVGKERVAKLLNGVSATAFGYIAIGTGTTAPAVGDTGAETEITREAATKSYEASYKAIFEKTFTFGSGESYAITEAIVSDSASASGEAILDRFTFTVKNVDSDTDLYVKVTITVV